MSLAEGRSFDQQAFPVLTEAQIGLLLPFGEVRPTRAGDVLFEVGDVRSGSVVVQAVHRYLQA